MPSKTSPESQQRALLVRDAIAVLAIEFPQAEDDRFRISIFMRLREEIPNLEHSQLTRLHEAACKADAKHAGVPEIRTSLRHALGRAYDLAGARARAKAAAAAPPAK